MAAHVCWVLVLFVVLFSIFIICKQKNVDIFFPNKKCKTFELIQLRLLFGLESKFYWFMVSKQLCCFAFFFHHFSESTHNWECKRGGESYCWNTNTNRLGKKETDDGLLSGWQMLAYFLLTNLKHRADCPPHTHIHNLPSTHSHFLSIWHTHNQSRKYKNITHTHTHHRVRCQQD